MIAIPDRVSNPHEAHSPPQLLDQNLGAKISANMLMPWMTMPPLPRHTTRFGMVSPMSSLLAGLLLGAIWLAAVPTAAAETPTLEQILERVQGAQAIEARFEQTKHLALLASDVNSSGTFSYRAEAEGEPSSLTWDYQQPQPMIFRIRGATLTTEDPTSGQRQELRLDSSPVAMRVISPGGR